MTTIVMHAHYDPGLPRTMTETHGDEACNTEDEDDIYLRLARIRDRH
jgi:hypothetical protein